MNPKTANTARPANPSVTQKDKDAAKQCLMLADKFLKESDFQKAREEVGKAQKLDPTNPYAYAFLDRIAYFEEQKKKGMPSERPHPAPVQQASAAEKGVQGPQLTPPPQKPQAPPSATKPVAPPVPAPPKPAVPRPEATASAPPQAPKREPPPAAPKPDAPVLPKPEPPAVAPRRPAPVESVVEASRSVIQDLVSSRAKSSPPPSPPAPGIADVLQQISAASHQHTPNAPRADIDSKLEEMRRQIEMLTNALDQERRVREEMNQQQLKGAVKQFRSALETAWANGAPKDEEARQLKDMALALGIPEDVIHTLNREVKLDMYSRAVKEVVSKQKLLRNSSRTLEWLRKVYQVSLDEYLEYESKFLMDLVADQYKGTILLVSGDAKTSAEMGQKLKAIGYAVVGATSPENALEKIEKINPHFILCDMEFSQGYLSGIKFLHVLRANSKFNYIPFILMCEPKEMTQIQSSELRPTEGCLQKPIDSEQLNTCMNEKLVAFRQYLSSL